jgi:hypothetical protein
MEIDEIQMDGEVALSNSKFASGDEKLASKTEAAISK